WLDYFGRRFVKVGRVWLFAILPDALSRRRAAICANSDCPRHYRHHLWRDGRGGAERFEIACRVFIRVAHGIHHSWHFCFFAASVERRGIANGESWSFDRRVVPIRRAVI